VADVLLFSKADVLTRTEREAAEIFAAGLSPKKALVAYVGPDVSCIEALAVAPLPAKQQRRSLLHRVLAPASAQAAGSQNSLNTEHAESLAAEAAQAKIPPYHYHELAQEHVIGGWILPAVWCFRHDDLLTELMTWRDAGRVKGVFHTDKGWIFFNATALDLAVRSSEYRSDSRVEVISPIEIDWADRERRLLACLIVESTQADTALPADQQQQQAQQ
jgi:G3E family GTPase